MKRIMNSIVSYLRRTDRVLWTFCYVLAALGILLLFGLLNSEYTELLELRRRHLAVQGVGVLLGTLCAVILSLIDYKDLIKLWRLHATLAYALVLLTFFIGVGTPDRPEDRRWLEIPGVTQLQPIELLRISFILVYALHIFLVHDRINQPLNLLGLLVHGAAPVLLAHFQGDDGSALIFAVMVVFMLFGAGISWKYVIAGVALLPPSLYLAWNYVLDDFQKRRFQVLYNPTYEDIRGDFYQQYHALIAFSRGSSGGSGIFGAEHTYVPAMHTDFLFSFLGESMGFVGCLFTVAVMVALWLKILGCSAKARDMQGKMICIGVFAMLSVQAIINIGMNIAVLPVIGNPLPFMSYGGTSMLTSFLGMGLVLSVSMHSSKTMFS
jgi:rod shape determining protein RodA